MLFSKLALLVIAAVAGPALAAPATVELESRALPSGADPALTLSTATLEAGFSCPGLSTSALPTNAKYLLLLPGTGTTGPVSWDHTWVPLSRQLGYTPCYISPPPDMLGDLQNAVEYAVYAVRKLHSRAGKKVPLLSWSAGGLVAQWMLTFYPQTRNQVDRLVAHAPDYQGTIEAYLLTALQYINPSIWQQTTFSHFVSALRNAGGASRPLVPTTNIFSITDEIVEPQTPNAIASSFLPGASNFRVQDTCGPLFILEHSQHLYNQAAYVIAKAALQSNTGTAPANALTTADCSELPPVGLTPADVVYDLTLIPQAGANILKDPKVTCEPPLRSFAKPYDVFPNVCFINPPESKTYAQAKGFTAPFPSLAAVSDYVIGGQAAVNQITALVQPKK